MYLLRYLHTESEQEKKGTEMTKKICAYCGKEFMVDEHRSGEMRRKYCSLDCSFQMDNKRDREKRRREKTGEIVRYERLCLCCGKKFTTNKENKIYCNTGCQLKAKAEREKVYGSEYREKKRQEKHQEEESKQKEQNQLHEANCKALASGMSYGKYYAMLYAEQNRHDAKKGEKQWGK